MEKCYFFLLFVMTSFVFYGQTPCDNANSDLIYAYSHVKSSYNANNISHLKYYANRSLEAFDRSKSKINKCGCNPAYNLAYDSAELLRKVETAETFEDGRFFVKRARELAQKCVVELDKCTVPTAQDQELTSLQIEQEKLKKQQEELKLKAEEIKAKLAAQEDLELKLKKEELINSYNTVISTNIETYNNALKICDCDKEVLKKIETDSEINTKSVEEIKQYFLKSLKGLTSNYLTQLDLCDD